MPLIPGWMWFAGIALVFWGIAMGHAKTGDQQNFQRTFVHLVRLRDDCHLGGEAGLR